VIEKTTPSPDIINGENGSVRLSTLAANTLGDPLDGLRVIALTTNSSHMVVLTKRQVMDLIVKLTLRLDTL
jgi:hypothetical protein